jgi:hypothetical protein
MYSEQKKKKSYENINLAPHKYLLLLCLENHIYLWTNVLLS